ncbi:MAG TPA: hypothetical protein VNF68_10220 [Candidatus Baltobacteraceae bacterium]|nr:hypothetical protein [Candidatus Baltobacteraceae bacterium]
MSRSYKDELAAAEQQGRAAYEKMEAWVSRPLGAPDLPGSVLEGYAKELRESRERLRRLLAEQGVRDDIEAALATSEQYHRSLGLSMKDKPELDETESEY